ncbi:M56 family metallopeptidase [Anaerobutyricum hallii]|uniref:M56 family metallopeptidase n=1 Tax=Anaerobutyricum hallii TaxID=39488 RepID=UPI00399AB188
MVLQLVMDMAGTFPILGYLLIKKIFKKHMTAQKYIWILRLSIILYLCPFQEFKYLILPEKLLERFNFADFWGIAGKKISGFEVVNIPSLFGDYYVTPRGIFLVTVIWFIICTILVIYYYGTYFFIKRQIRKNGIKTDFFSGKRGKDIEVFQTAKVKTPCTVGWLHPNIFIPKRDYTVKEKEWLLRHEITHVRHGDTFWKALALLVCIFHWYNPFVYYLFQQYSVMCEYYCDAVCMQNSNKEEKKNYAIFLVKSATLTIPRRGLAIVQGLTNNGEKIQERVDRILDEDKKPAGKIQLFIAGILTVMCLCSFMTIFVYSATQEQDVPAQDNTFTEGEWDYFYGEDVSMGDASLDFSKSTILFESKQGEITPVFQSNLMNNGSDKGQKKAQRCKKCGIVKKNQLSYDTDYVVCSHAKK